jgi:tRNA (adenine22-N1)-methyltransferase
VSDANKVKLGKRLTRIEAMVGRDYDHIWDCCCDHGLLGFQLLKNGKAKHVHFVDIVQPLLEEIESKLSRYYRGDNNWFVHCLDVGALPLARYQDEKHLVIIAGVGGQLLIELLTSMLPRLMSLHVEFILSPVHHNYQLRQFLVQQKGVLIEELIIEENKRFYELIHCQFTSDEHLHNNINDSPISLVGDKMWDFSEADHQTYLQQTIKHYQRIAKNPELDMREIIKAYQDLIPCVYPCYL